MSGCLPQVPVRNGGLYTVIQFGAIRLLRFAICQLLLIHYMCSTLRYGIIVDLLYNCIATKVDVKSSVGIMLGKFILVIYSHLGGNALKTIPSQLNNNIIVSH